MNPEQNDQPEIDRLLNVHAAIAHDLSDFSEVERLTSPFIDPRSLNDRMTADSRLFRREPSLNDTISRAYETNGSDDVFNAVDALARARSEYSPRNNPIATVFSILTTASAIMELSNRTATGGVEARQEALKTFNAIQSFDSRNVGNEIPLDQLKITFQVSNVITQLIAHDIQSGNSKAYQTAASILEYFTGYVKSRYIANEYIQRFPGTDAEKPSLEQVERDGEAISVLFKEVTNTRQFGMKMGYIEDQRGGSLVFNPTNHLAFMPDLAKHSVIEDAYHRSQALIVHSRETKFKKIKATAREIGDREVGSNSWVDLSGLHAINDLHLGKDGELYNDTTCQDPLVSMAVANGKYTAYRDFQATIISHYYDLTHPIEDVAHITGMQKSTPEATKRMTGDPTEMIAKLVIPRIHYRPNDQPTDENDIEIEEEVTELQNRRSVRSHNVVWHIRKLPEGWKAGPQAQEVARKIGVMLRDGETIVKEHRRGSQKLGEIVGHELIGRNNS